jgi:hypothetical protein
VTKTQTTRGTCKSKHGTDLAPSAGLPRLSIHVRTTVSSRNHDQGRFEEAAKEPAKKSPG